MNALHTPGPWAWETPMGEHCPWIVEAGKQAYEWQAIATLGDCTEDGPSPRSKAFQRVQADARLIAAAPTMLEALERAVDALASLRGDDEPPLTQVVRGRAAIALAKGAA